MARYPKGSGERPRRHLGPPPPVFMYGWDLGQLEARLRAARSLAGAITMLAREIEKLSALAEHGVRLATTCDEGLVLVTNTPGLPGFHNLGEAFLDTIIGDAGDGGASAQQDGERNG